MGGAAGTVADWTRTFDSQAAVASEGPGSVAVASSRGATAETNNPWPADAIRCAEVADPVPGCADPVRCREKFEGAAMVQSAFQLHNDQRKHRESLEPI